MRYWPEYVPVAKRRAQAAKHLKSSKKKGQALNPVIVVGRQIAHTFWGKAWCDNLENYSDYENRLPRGTHLRAQWFCDRSSDFRRESCAQVMGSHLYKVTIEIKAMKALKWKALIKACAGKIDSLIELAYRGNFLMELWR